MPPQLRTPRLTLVPLGAEDEDRVCELLWQPDVRRHLCDDALLPRETIRQVISDSGNPASASDYWRLASAGDDMVGLVGLRPPSTASLALRAIGWRSRELVIALDRRFWGRGLAHEAVEAVAEHAGRDGVTFALVGCVDAANDRSHRLMRRCGFHELGRTPAPPSGIVVYERAV